MAAQATDESTALWPSSIEITYSQGQGKRAHIDKLQLVTYLHIYPSTYLPTKPRTHLASHVG